MTVWLVFARSTIQFPHFYFCVLWCFSPAAPFSLSPIQSANGSSSSSTMHTVTLQLLHPAAKLGCQCAQVLAQQSCLLLLLLSYLCYLWSQIWTLAAAATVLVHGHTSALATVLWRWWWWWSLCLRMITWHKGGPPRTLFCIHLICLSLADSFCGHRRCAVALALMFCSKWHNLVLSCAAAAATTIWPMHCEEECVCVRDDRAKEGKEDGEEKKEVRIMKSITWPSGQSRDAVQCSSAVI